MDGSDVTRRSAVGVRGPYRSYSDLLQAAREKNLLLLRNPDV